MFQEHPLVIPCAGERLVAVVCRPPQPRQVAVVIIVGGPQYRAGSHRQFTLLARSLAHRGYASIRFDYRGMGDSEGEPRNFETVNPDVRAAANALLAQVPEARRLALWGLCDAASAALFYAPEDPRVSGMMLLNPWVHTEAGAARTRLKHYYLSRLTDLDFWRRLLTGQVNVGGAVGGLAESARQSAGDAQAAALTDPRHGSPGYVDRMLTGLKAFRGAIHILLSGEDLVAREFEERMRSDKGWTRACKTPRLAFSPVPGANHTFSSAPWRAEVEERTARWLDSLA